MKSKLAKAIDNNHGLYESVFAPLGIKSFRTDTCWYCPERTPPLYSNLVTRSRNWRPDENFKAIEAISQQEKWEQWSMKDSFAALNMRAYGFERLFDAQWMYLDASKFKSPVANSRLAYGTVVDKSALQQWWRAWDDGEELGLKIFSDEMIRDAKLKFIMGRGTGSIESGCILNWSDDIVGISNFFAPDTTIDYWSHIIDHLYREFGPIDIVGYERHNTLADLRQLGFEALGDLTVWNRKGH